MDLGRGETARARSGSFKPWPVSTQTTVPAARANSGFSRANFLTPATDAALAGSQ